jgi:2-oxoglutarate ferredoxin oxidoreductase subunit beta
MSAVLRAIASLGWKKDEVVVVSGIGCASRIPGYLDFHTLHTTHGRSLAFATGVKLANPKLKVISIMGDGDAVAIGGNHFIHSIRRNLNITTIILNNNIYGMTGGQYSPTTPCGANAATSPYGNIEPSFDICQLSVGCGAGYVARATVHQPIQAEKYIAKALQYPGFSVVEVVTTCPTGYGSRNRMNKGLEMLKWLKDRTVSISAKEGMSPEELKDKIVVGEFIDDATRTKNYLSSYEADVVPKAMAKLASGHHDDIDRKPRKNPLGVRCEIRLSGSGGQGVKVASKILAKAAGIWDDCYVTKTQLYGPEARGGATKADVVISEQEICYPKARKADILVALNQESVDLFVPTMKDNAVIIIDASLADSCPRTGSYWIPFTKIARQEFETPLVANILALGALISITGAVSEEAMREAVKHVLTKQTEKNLKALERGFALGKTAERR